MFSIYLLEDNDKQRAYYREIIDNTYKGFALYSLVFIWAIMMIIGFYNRIKYGSKDWEYVEETKRGIFGLIGLFVMAILMYLFI